VYYHTAYGLSFASEHPIPGFAVSTGSVSPDIVVHLGQLPGWFDQSELTREEPFYAGTALDATGTPVQRIWEAPRGHYLLVFSEGVTFLVDEAGRKIWGRWCSSVPLELAALYLRGPLMSFVLGLQGFVCLHASAVVIDGRAVVFAGFSGAGKSTTAMTFARRGFAALTDDIVAIPGNAQGLTVQPGYPRLCVWPVSAVVGPWVDELPRVIPDEDKRYVSLEADKGGYHPVSIELGAIYLLDPRNAGSCEPGVEELAGAEGLVSLLANNCGSGRLSREHRARAFETLGRIISQIPVRRVRIPRDPGRLDELCDLILRDFRTSLE
jgi:hypothetical protein